MESRKLELMEEGYKKLFLQQLLSKILILKQYIFLILINIIFFISEAFNPENGFFIET